jgi:hypothetical protein
MNVQLDPTDQKLLEELAEEKGVTVDALAREIFHRALQETNGEGSEAGNELLDWEVSLPTPPPRACGTIKVGLRYSGRTEPHPIAEE